MSKKTKRTNRPQSESASTANAAARPTRSQVEAFNPDYTYVRKDLRRIGILAGTFLTILVVLSFFLR